jgi:peptidoglycan hydrolase-like protein with peptidoglycan-binding domain
MGLMMYSILGGIAYGGYLLFGKSTPQLQSLRRMIPGTSTPVQVVVPVVKTPPVNGVSSVPVLPGNGPAASYTPPTPNPVAALNTQLAALITPSGASNFSIQTNQDVQKALNTLGYGNPPLTVDGKIGPLSVAAIKAFQSAHSLTSDGVAGPQTKSALQTALLASAATGVATGLSAVVQSATVDTVKNIATAVANPVTTSVQVQHALNLLGASPALTEDGKIGPASTAAVKAFQISHGLAADGVPGPKTMTALTLALNPSTPAGEFGVDMHRRFMTKKQVKKENKKAGIGSFG